MKLFHLQMLILVVTLLAEQFMRPKFVLLQVPAKLLLSIQVSQLVKTIGDLTRTEHLVLLEWGQILVFGMVS